MARGWESKAVESQVEDDQRAREEREAYREPEQIERDQKREGLERQRARIERELAAAESPLRRTALEHALLWLQGELSRMES